MKSVNIGFVGLGTMGYPMAGHLCKAGFDVTVYNRTSTKADAWQSEFGGASAAELAILARHCQVVFTCVGNDDDVQSIYLGERGLIRNASAKTIFVDHTTTSAKLAKELAHEAQLQGCEFIDAPVSGGQAGAENGALAIMVGGNSSTYEYVQPLLKPYAKSITYLGDVGSGQLCKMVNQICITGILQGLSEATVFAEQAGLDLALVKEAIAGGAAGSWQLNNRLHTMHERKFDFGFAVDWMRKDLQFCFDQAAELGVQLPCAKTVDEQYKILQKAGEARSDTSVLIKQFDSDE